MGEPSYRSPPTHLEASNQLYAMHPLFSVGSASEDHQFGIFEPDHRDHVQLEDGITTVLSSTQLEPQLNLACNRQSDWEPSVPPNLAVRNSRQTKYSEVSVLLICWEEERGSSIETELVKLRNVFDQDFSFSTRAYYIPSKNSLLSLSGEVVAFLGEDDPEQLKIIYYGGHGELAKGRQSLWKSSKPEGRDGKFPSILWNGIQNMFETANSDILVLLGCCSFITSTPDDQRRGITEYLMAYGFNDTPRTPNYFSHALITELGKLAKRPSSFSVAELHTLIFANVQERMFEQATPLEAPMHIFLPGYSNSSFGICLASMRDP
jgi:hypothetical protein